MKRTIITFTVCREGEGGPVPLTGALSCAEATAAHNRHRAPGQNLPVDRRGARLSIVVSTHTETAPVGQLGLFGGAL